MTSKVTQISSINTQIYDSKVDRAGMLRLVENKFNEDISSAITRHAGNMNDIVLNSDLRRSSQVATMKKATQKEIETTYASLYAKSSRNLIELALDETSYMYQALDARIGNVWRTGRPTRRVAEDIVLNRPLYKNMTLAQGWAGVSVGERKRLEGIIRQQIAAGATEGQLALALRESALYRMSMQQSKGLSRTAMTSVYNEADMEILEANRDVLEGYQFVAVLDSRTTEECGEHDGQIYEIGDIDNMPPLHWNCRSTITPVVKDYATLGELDNLANMRIFNLSELSSEERAAYDGLTPLRESYDAWLRRQPYEVQLRHIGDYKKLELFQQRQLTLEGFASGNRQLSLSELMAKTEVGEALPGDTLKFANAKDRLDAIRFSVMRPEDLYAIENTTKLIDYMLLQAGDLEGTLSFTNYRGITVGNKKLTRRRILTSPPTEKQLVYNPITRNYDDSRLYQPSFGVHNNSLQQIERSSRLLASDKEWLVKLDSLLENKLALNERSVVMQNLRVNIERYRDKKEPWLNFKAVINGEMKFSVMNVSDEIETLLRHEMNVFKKLAIEGYRDAVLGDTTLDKLSKEFISSIIKRNKFDDTTIFSVARELQGYSSRFLYDAKLPFSVETRLTQSQIDNFYVKFARLLSQADLPDRDQMAVTLGRGLYNLAGYRGTRNQWYNLGVGILDDAKGKGFYRLDTWGVQKRRMHKRTGSGYFGPYYDTQTVNVVVTDKRLLEYAELQRKIDVGLRLPVLRDADALYVRPGYKTYFTTGGVDTRIPIISVDSFSGFPTEFIDKQMADALNWAGKSRWRIDREYYDAMNRLLNFVDDKGKAAHYANLNKYREFLNTRGDVYERFKAMDWLVKKDAKFSNTPFIDHRGRIYDRGMISPQSGETFRPYINASEAKYITQADFYNLQDQIGSFLGGLSEKIEGAHNSLTFAGRQKIAEEWRKDMVQIGEALLRGKPKDIRFLLDHRLVQLIDGEDLGKFYRLAMETAKIDRHLLGNYGDTWLSQRITTYKTALALEQDASSSGAQIIALTTKNKQLAELSNVVPTTSKKRLYDEIARLTYNDPKFRELNQRLGLTERDLRKAAKAQNMVTFYGAGERTGAMNVETKLGKILGNREGTLVIKAAERDAVLEEISAKAARFRDIDKATYDELMALRADVRAIFQNGLAAGDDIMEQLYFLDSKTRAFVEKLSAAYDKVITPVDFARVAEIMSTYLAEQVPILRSFTSFLGRAAADFLENAKPNASAFSFKDFIKTAVYGDKKRGYVLPDWMSELFGLKKGEAVSEKILKRFSWYEPNGTFANILYGVKSPESRITGSKFFGLNIADINIVKSVKLGFVNKLPKSWTSVPSVNFDGKVIEQHFTQTFEERLRYRTSDGKWVTNILQVPQKTDPTWWQEFIHADGKINDIADLAKARTAFGVNMNHSNDATLVKAFHLWGREYDIQTSTIHDAFFTSLADMRNAKHQLRQIYSNAVNKNVIKQTLDEMRARGMPFDVYQKYLNEAIETGLIPIVGRSRIAGKLLTADDILTPQMILENIPENFFKNRGWYGIG